MSTTNVKAAKPLTALDHVKRYVMPVKPTKTRTSQVTARTKAKGQTIPVEKLAAQKDIRFGWETMIVDVGSMPTLSYAQARRILDRGISSKVIQPMSLSLGVGMADLSSFLEIDRGTVKRRADKNQALPTHSAEGVLRLLELEAIAIDTFESQADAHGWLRKPHPLLGGESPLEAAKTGFGAQRVKEILIATKYGGAA